MRRRSLVIRAWALFGAFAIVFAQVATAAYACPGGHEGGMGSQPLCAKVCQDEPQKNDTPSLAALPPSPDSGLRVETPSPARMQHHVAADATLERATSPPPTILYARFLK